MTNAEHNQQVKRVLFLDKVLIRGKKKITAVNGAERFNLNLVGQLQEHGLEVNLLAAKSWEKDIRELSDRGRLSLIRLPHIFKIAWPNTALSTLRLRLKRPAVDVLILGNVGKNLLPLVKMLHRKNCFKHLVLIAHREATPMYLRLLRGLKPTIIAVNQQIANGFRAAGYEDTHVYFGEIRTTLFTPITRSAIEKQSFNFCVFGSLDAEWKGSDVAIRVFQSLPEDVRKCSQLHLAGFATRKPTIDDPQIKVYSWIPESEVPAFLSQMDVALIPSRDTSIMKETFSQASVQAMLMGLPLIVSTLPILTEKVAEGGGLIFSTEDELREHMLTLYRDKKLRDTLGSESREIARKRFLWDTSYFIKTFLALPTHSSAAIPEVGFAA